MNSRDCAHPDPSQATEREDGLPEDDALIGHGQGRMVVRCQRCAGEAIVIAPFSQAPRIHYPAALKTCCEELKAQATAGYPETDAGKCATLRRTITAAMGGRDD